MIPSIPRLLGFLLLFNLYSGSVQSSDLPKTLQQIRSGVVAVGTIMPVPHSAARKPKARFYGTGFVIGNGRKVITNHHVVPEEFNDKKKEVLAIFAGRGKSAIARKARVLRADPEHDLALLEFDGPALNPLELDTQGSIAEGEEVAFTGFPLGMALGLYPVTNKTIVAAKTPIVIPANSSRKLTAVQIKRLKTPYEVYQLDAIAYPGNSGSPVYRIDSGKVIGVVNSVFVKGSKEAMLKTPSGISYAIPTRYIFDLMIKR
ncbi:MAG: serine protease [Sedimenticola sp.]